MHPRLVAVGLTLTIAACATAPPAADLTPRPDKATDAKTQLESGKTRLVGSAFAAGNCQCEAIWRASSSPGARTIPDMRS